MIEYNSFVFGKGNIFYMYFIIYSHRKISLQSEYLQFMGKKNHICLNCHINNYLDTYLILLLKQKTCAR